MNNMINNFNTRTMNHKFTYDKVKKVFYELFISLLLIYAYNVIFRTISGLNYTQSKVLLISLLIGFLCIRMIAFKKPSTIHRPVFYILPFGIYTSISFFTLLTKPIIIITLVALFLCAAYFVYAVFKTFQKRRLNAQNVKRNLKKGFFSICLIISIGCSILMTPLAIKTLLGIPILPATTKAEAGTSDFEYVLSDHFDTVSTIYDGSWKNLNTKERLEVLQTIANIESNYLGLSHELNVCAEVLGENLVGRYDEQRHRIEININFLKNENPEELLGTICHEAYHSYEYQMIYVYDSIDEKERELMIFRDVPDYIEEFSSYTHGEVDFEDYEAQTVEVNAREYAKIAMQEYKMRTTDYIKSNESQQPFESEV
ncbi:MAG: hypothetical protein Q4C46_03065 [Bacillota bacterium]|nr:hypothetical protein [Bacillota bacterium]